MSGVFQNIDPPSPSPPGDCVLESSDFYIFLEIQYASRVFGLVLKS
jgi:hypothetical protein